MEQRLQTASVLPRKVEDLLRERIGGKLLLKWRPAQINGWLEFPYFQYPLTKCHHCRCKRVLWDLEADRHR